MTAGSTGIAPAPIQIGSKNFVWGPESNHEMLCRLGELRELGRPLLLGTLRKSTVGYVIDRSPADRQWGTAATVTLAVQQGVDICALTMSRR